MIYISLSCYVTDYQYYVPRGTSEKYHLLYLNLLRKEMYNSMIYSILLHCPVANVPRRDKYDLIKFMLALLTSQ